MNEPGKTPTRQRLIDAGAALMAERGFGGVSVREICKHAGTSMNMIHHFFGSKAGLLDAIVADFGLHVLETPMRLLDTQVRSRDDFISRIELLFEATLEAYLARRDVMMVVIREQADAPALTAYIVQFAAFLRTAQDLGFVREALDAEMVSGALLDRLMNQVQFAPWLKRNYGVDLKEDRVYRQRWCRSNVDLFLNGMVA